VNKVVELLKAYPPIWGVGLVAIVALVAITIYCRFGTAKSQVMWLEL